MEVELIPIKDENDGMFYYFIPKGSKIYRADNRFKMGEKRWDEITKRPTFFALNKEDAENNYGVTYTLFTDKEYKLLALDNKITIERLLSEIDNEKIKRILELHYGYKSTRDSQLKHDLKITDYLCKQGYQGYATNVMSTDFGGNFHAEIMICDPKGIHSPIQVTDETRVQKMIEDYRLKRLHREPSVKKKNKKSIFIIKDSDAYTDVYEKNTNNDYRKSLFESPLHSIQNRNLFGDESYASPIRSTRNNLFGFSPSPPHSTRKIYTKSPSPRKSPNRRKKNKTPTKGGKGNKQNKTKKQKK
jgi:hypothetical protein